MKTKTISTALTLLLITVNSMFAQAQKPLTEADKASLEGIIVEKYYTYNAKDALDTAGGAIPAGSITYRIYVDLKPNYTLQAVYGVIDHPMFIKTSTTFYNNTKYGQATGDYIESKKIAGSTAAFDSWITAGACSTTQNGVMLADDKDGSMLNIPSMAKADGMVAGKIKPVTFFGIMPNTVFNTATSSSFATDNGSWAVFGGVKGATDDNKILIAQITTDGKLSFELNLQIGTPTGGNVNYVARNPQSQTEQILFKDLIYESPNNNNNQPKN
jgi:hypothetical protein